MGIAIEEAYRLPEPPFLAERFIDAVHWFGLAMRDTTPPSRLIMLLMAVERFLLPVRVKAVLSAVRLRSAPFADWSGHNERVNAVYDVRGRLVHGQLSAQSLEVIDACKDAQILARGVLFEALYLIGENALRANDKSPAILERALVKLAKDYTMQRMQAATSRRRNASS